MAPLHMPGVVLGVMAFAPTREALRVRTIHAALDAGITALDTAPLYEFGASERVVGRALADRPGRVRVWSKVGLRWDGEHGDILLRSGGKTVRKDSRPDAVRRDVHESLTRLGVDALDLCLVHHVDKHTPIADTMGALLRLRDEGKIRAIGVSNYDAHQTRQAVDALGDVPLAGHQGRLSLLHREVQTTLLPTLGALAIPFFAYSPLAQGLVAGGASGGGLPQGDWRAYESGFRHDTRKQIAGACGVLRGLAREHEVSLARVALAWVLAQRHVHGVVVGASSPHQICDAARASELSLDETGRRSLARAFAGVRIHAPWGAPRARGRLRRWGARAWARVGG